MLLFHICSTVKSSSFPSALSPPPPFGFFLFPTTAAFTAPHPFFDMPLLPQHLAPLVAALPHTVRGTLSLSSYSLSLSLSRPSCVQFLYATKSPKCASHIVEYKLVARAEEHSCSLALEIRLSLLYYYTVSKTHGVIIEHRN